MPLYIGDRVVFKITVQDSDGNAFNITDYNVEFTASGPANLSKKSTVGIAEIEKTDPTNGICYVYLKPADTTKEGTYKYDIEIMHTSDATKVYTVKVGTFTLDKAVKNPS